MSIFTHAEFSYNYAEITHTTIDYDDFGDATVIEFDVSFETPANIFIGWGYGNGDFDDIDLDLDVFRFGVGYHMPIIEGADLVSQIDYFIGEAKGPSPSDIDIEGYGISIGIRAKLAEKVEVLVGVIYSDTDVESVGVSVSDSDTDFGANIALDLTDSLQAVIDIDGDDQSLGLRLHF
jgi:hypothetical protein